MVHPRRDPALLALADGRVFPGWAFGARGVASGEVVFNTSMTGYQEILTDPSYCRQIVAMTCPEIGNVGVNRDDVESDGVKVAGFVVRSLSPVVSNWRAGGALEDWLEEAGVVGIEGVDTRALTRHIRQLGAVPGVVLSPAGPEDAERAVAFARDVPAMEGQDLVGEVSCREPYEFTEPVWQWGVEPGQGPPPQQRHVVAYDFGIKRNILRLLVSAGCRVTVVPSTFPSAEALALAPDGLFLSNGPGDPAALSYAIDTVKELVGTKPLFGICLGHQVLALALGGRTYKLKFGHRGSNQPVQDLSTGRVEITSQNHGFAVDADSLSGLGVSISHVNLNDGTVEGFEHDHERAFAVQYHPEASPGPHDALPHFERFLVAMDGER